ncbi:MAG: CPBP family intramembrane metalloprotease [Theionarchaea archaeon]|nr:CPBP family intramembrane metalloprotease [Theionarchaea archaeon]MBU7001507.1 CPBP family intramembrane metalloprotease [Theionarchaea archaeon]MBU7019720.1 CPBP family intramembrane metalloprotease [Theionarchaea archaeon]MBU7034431.1 CPBP family intramembrane metalloprotease [Theionarchaea archaeon]MBU7040642.1 CPBP family intramembrane metalloprotease [Theionarchaea archaeon]
MANWLVFLCLFVVSIPGIVVTVPGAITSMEARIKESAPPGKKIPSMRVILTLGILQSLVLVLIADAAGTITTPSIGFSAPFFEALVTGEHIWNSLQPQLLPSFVLGIGGGALFVALYYLVFRPRLDDETVKVMEKLRMDLGLSGRILYGGIVEEVLTRWGLQSVVIWVGSLITGVVTPATIWGSIIIAGILFGLGHLPSYLGAGCRKTPLFIAFEITLNLLASLIFGWLFWNYGLLASMIAHALFHVVWYPFDVRTYKER